MGNSVEHLFNELGGKTRKFGKETSTEEIKQNCLESDIVISGVGIREFVK